MPDPAGAGGSLLRALRLFKAIDPGLSLNEVIVFLCACEREGSSIQALSQAAGLSQSTASRSVRALGPPDSDWSRPPAVGLLRPFIAPNDARSHVVFPTPRGLELRAELDAIVAEGRPIAAGPAG